MDKVNSKEVSQKASTGLRYYSINSILTYLLQFLSTMFLSKLLSASDYGLFGTIRSWIASVAYFTDIGISEGLVQQKDNLSIIQIKNYLAIRSALSLFSCTVISIIIYFYHKELGFNDSIFLYISIITLFTFLDFFANLPKLYFAKKLEFSSLAKTELMSNVLLYAFQIMLAIIGFGVWSLFIGLGLKFLVFVIFGIKNKVYFFPSFQKMTELRHLFRRGVYLQSTLILIGLSSFLIPFLLNLQLSKEDVGIYFWINSLVTLPVGLILNFQSVLFPAFSKLQDHKDELIALVNKSFNLFSILIIMIFFSGFIFSDFIIDILFPEKWSRAKDIVELLCFSTAFYCIRQIPQTIMTSLALARDKLISELSYFLSLIIPISLSILLKYEFTLYDFITLLVVANLFGTLVSFVLIRDLITIEVKIRYFLLSIIFLIGTLIINIFVDQWHQIFGLFSILIFIFIAVPSFRNDFYSILDKLKKSS